MFDATQSPEASPKTTETGLIPHFDELIDLSQGSPVYRTQAKDGGIYTWDATELVGLSPQERKEILTDLLLRIGSVAEVAIKNTLDYLFVFDPQSSETGIEQYGAFSRELNQKTVSQVFRLVIKKAQERGEREKVIALEHALRNGCRLPRFRNQIGEIQKEQGVSPQEAFESLLFKNLDPDNFELLGSGHYPLITVGEYRQRRAEEEAGSQPVKERLGVTMELNYPRDPVSQAAKRTIMKRFREQLGDKLLKEETDNKGTTIFTVQLDCTNLLQRDLKQIRRAMDILKPQLYVFRDLKSNLTVDQALQRIIKQKEEFQEFRETSPYFSSDSKETESNTQMLRIFRFLERNLDVIPGLRETVLQDLREDDWSQFTKVMGTIKPIEEGKTTPASTE